MSYFARVKEAWLQRWDDRVFRSHLLLTILAYAVFLHFGINYISRMEFRHGRVLADPVLETLAPRDFSIFIFLLLYTCIISTAIRFLLLPDKFLLGLQAGLAILTVRTLSIYLVPLEPPPGMILLRDPFISLVFGSSANVAVKDLFFSGHVGSMCVLVYFTDPKPAKLFLAFSTFFIGLFIAWQHVHYTIDLLAAPLFGFSLCFMVSQLHVRSEYGISTPELNWKELP